ncbi:MULTISPECIES: hypothetical protein [unclassified Rhizobium]|uniref:hypothetical protein n=1 Tax=unclassified Rhizobium TaxID=2613769 RepID=UPI001AD97EC5|nr:MULTISPECIES: hypothetical protein [unclassified Rhizobium]MBO9096591.1 hypothetical protein [Rhizobium sp. L58/93]MBO9136329.1 hypothetical protein [Rhizobium sp. B209b/85]MBO9166847.1 hypothetical protein [Rhizobium sp. L245/93]MBO9182819.1 hypothetical protein [Rhizobium sp. E27B/91]QXZ82717.1 hypothetical protein J5287_11495 [Rhizobium sp. K1/93]
MKLFAATLLFSTVLTLPVGAQSSISTDRGQLIESYRAFISAVDIINSNGDRLSEPWQIIRQDRANYHHFHLMDADDETDTFFASPANRQLMEAMLADGEIEGDAAERIVAGDVHIKVDIYGHGTTGERIDVHIED